MTPLKFILVDRDRRRAAAISAGLSGHRGVVVTDSLAALTASPKGHCIVLAADEHDAIRQVVTRMKETGLRAKLIAYAEDPSPHQMVKAMAAGAADYLNWPCDIASIVAAATAATAEAAG